MWLVYAVSAAAVWGLDYALGERVLKNKISPTSLMTVQMALGTMFFLTVGYAGSLKQDFQIIISDRKVLGLTLAAIASFNFGNWLIFLSIQAKNATIAGLIELCYPVFTALFTYFLFKENHLSPSVLVGSIFILIGIFIIGYWV